MYEYIIQLVITTFSQDYDLASHTTYVGRVNFIQEWHDGTYSLK